MTNPRLARIAFILLLVTALALTCGCSRDKTSTDPGASTDASAPAEDADAQPTAIVSYFLGFEKVLPVRRFAQTEGVAKDALVALVEGPTAAESQNGLMTLIPAGTQVLGVVIDQAGIATIDLSKEFTLGGGSLSMMGRVSQVVFTATQFANVKGVSFQIEGTDLTILGGEGIMLDTPQTREDWEGFAPEILVESPVRGDTLKITEPLRVTGSANVFEASFYLEVLDGGGTVVSEQSIRATSGTGTRGTFDATVALPASAKAGIGSIVVSYFSAKDGSKIVVDRIPAVVQ